MRLYNEMYVQPDGYSVILAGSARQLTLSIFTVKFVQI